MRLLCRTEKGLETITTDRRKHGAHDVAHARLPPGQGRVSHENLECALVLLETAPIRTSTTWAKHR